MKIDKSKLSKVLQIVSKVVNPKSIIPLFSNLLFEVNGNIVEITGTNLEIGIQATFEIEDTGDFKTAVSAKLFTELTNTLQGDEIELQFNEKIQQLTVKTKKNKNNIKCMNADDFPEIPSIGKKYIEFETNLFKQIINRVSFSAHTDTNNFLSNILITNDNGKLVFCAVDGFRLSYEEFELSEKYKNIPFYALVSSNAVELVAKILANDTAMKFETTEKVMKIECNNITAVIQISNGKFPDYKMFTKKKINTEITANTISLLKNCKQLELFADENMLLNFNVNGMLLELFTSSDGSGDSHITADATVSGNSISLGLNVYYLRQFLEVCSTEEAVIQIHDNKYAIFFQMKDYDNYYHIIMPMGVKE